MEKSPSEIVKLTERISKDPKSKLFVPLAEEYKKIGDVEMAIHVLSEGLKQNPTYITARSLLGKLLLESGDLTAAQKEFEEVVRAIPDNLLGRRKLGDLYLRQNKKEEALQHYKAALGLNPGDKAFAKQVEELESQLRASAVPEQKIESKPQPTAPPEEQAKQLAPGKEAAPAAAETQKAPEPAAALPAEVTAPGPEKAESIQPVESITTPELAVMPMEQPKQPETSLFAEADKEPSIPLFETEEAEDVLAFEPLEEESPGIQEKTSAPQPLEELKEEKPEFDTFTPPAAAEKPQDTPVIAPETLLREATGQEEEIVPAEELDFFTEAAPEPREVPEIDEDKSKLAGAEDLEALVSAAVESVPAEEEKGAEAEAVQEAPSPQADDFTTDTLAELYIAQGFYEKAIDIYQRMLADHPESVGLKNKLGRVKAMAGVAEAEAAAGAVTTAPREETPAPERVFTKEVAAQVEEPAKEQQQEEEEITLDAEILLEPEEEALEAAMPEEKRESPAETADEEKAPSIFEEPTHDVFTISEDESLKTVYRDFEPKEYIPPDASPKRAATSAAAAELAPLPAEKKETIDRLEKWLSAIKKEK